MNMLLWRNWQTLQTKDLVPVMGMWVRVPPGVLLKTFSKVCTYNKRAVYVPPLNGKDLIRMIIKTSLLQKIKLFVKSCVAKTARDTVGTLPEYLQQITNNILYRAVVQWSRTSDFQSGDRGFESRLRDRYIAGWSSGQLARPITWRSGVRIPLPLQIGPLTQLVRVPDS